MKPIIIFKKNNCTQLDEMTKQGWTDFTVLTHSVNKFTCMEKAAPWLKRLVAGFPQRRPGFEPGSDHVGFVVDKVALGQVFLQVLRFPLSIFIPPIAPQSPSSIIRGWYSRPNTGRPTKWTQSHSSICMGTDLDLTCSGTPAEKQRFTLPCIYCITNIYFRTQVFA
jgi:hypothetical protein